MKYFQNFPAVPYTLTETINGFPQELTRVVPNMTIRFDTTYQLGDYEWYRIEDRDRPDTLAAQWYGSTRYTWVVMLSNNLRDMYDWPMTSLEFYDYMNRKYETTEGARDGFTESQNTIYQYRWTDPVTKQEIIVDETLYITKPANQRREFTIYDYETEQNDIKRDIRRLNDLSFSSFVRQFNQLMGQ